MIKRFTEALKQVENGARVGFDPVKGLWFPHTSPEGGADTIGYGHKIRAYQDFTFGITSEWVDKILVEDIFNAANKITEDYPEKYHLVLVNIIFNTGSCRKSAWPKLYAAIEAGDDVKVRKEMISSYKDADGKRHRLLTRAITIADAIGLDYE